MPSYIIGRVTCRLSFYYPRVGRYRLIVCSQLVQCPGFPVQCNNIAGICNEDPVKILYRVFKTLLCGETSPYLKISIVVIRDESDRLFKGCERIIKFFKPEKGNSEVILCLSEFGLQRDSVLKRSNGFGIVPECKERPALVMPCVRVVGFYLQCP